MVFIIMNNHHHHSISNKIPQANAITVQGKCANIKATVKSAITTTNCMCRTMSRTGMPHPMVMLKISQL